jgi:DNA-binding protein HU-beta
MSKQDLINDIAAATGLTKVSAGRALDATTDAITKSLKKGESVTLIGFGTFKVSKRAARAGRNPQTGAALKIAARNAATFTAGKALKEALNK